MARIKKYILILVLILIVSGVILGYLLLNNENNIQGDFPDEQPWIPTEDISKTVQVVDVRNEFYTIKRCVEKFYIYYADIFNDPSLIQDKNLYDVLCSINVDEKIEEFNEEYFKILTEDLELNQRITILKEKIKFEKDHEKQKQYLKELSEKYSVWIEPVYFEMTDSCEMKNAFMKIRKVQKNVDILINNAGTTYDALLPMLSIEKSQELFHVNFVFLLLYSNQKFLDYFYNISHLLCMCKVLH